MMEKSFNLNLNLDPDTPLNPQRYNNYCFFFFYQPSETLCQFMVPCVFFLFLHALEAQMVGHQAVMLEVVGSNPFGINTWDLKITELEKVLPL